MTDLDTRIRTLIADAVSAAPSPPDVRRTASTSPARRRWWPAATLVGAVAAAVAVVAVRDGRGDHVRVVPGDTAVSQPNTVTVPTTRDTVDAAVPVTVPPQSDLTIAPFSWATDVSVVLRNVDGLAVLHGDGSHDLYGPDDVPGDRVWQVDGRLIGGAPSDLLALADFLSVYDTSGPSLNLGQGIDPVSGRFFVLISGEQTTSFDADRLTLGTDRLVGQVDTDNGWLPVAFTPDGNEITDFAQQIGIGEQSKLCDCPRLFSISPSGHTIGWVHMREFVTLVDGAERRYPLPDGAKIHDLDMTDDAVVLNRTEGGATLLDLRDGATDTLPAEGFATIALGDDGQPTPPNLPDGLASLLHTAAGLVITGGADPSDPIAADPFVAFFDPRGGIIYQESQETIMRWTGFDQPPNDMFAAADFAGPVVLRDVAVVNGVPSMLYSVGIGCDSGPDDCEVHLYLSGLEASTVTDLGVFGGWESDTTVSISENGLLVGWRRGSADLRPYVADLGGDELSFAADRGIDRWFTYCLGGTPCPREFTVSDDGSRIVWLNEAGDLVIAAPDGDPADDVIVPAAFPLKDIVDVVGDFILVRRDDVSWIVRVSAGSADEAEWHEVPGRGFDLSVHTD